MTNNNKNYNRTFFAIFRETVDQAGYVSVDVTFPGLSGCSTWADSWPRALSMASDVLLVWLENLDAGILVIPQKYEHIISEMQVNDRVMGFNPMLERKVIQKFY